MKSSRTPVAALLAACLLAVVARAFAADTPMTDAEVEYLITLGRAGDITGLALTCPAVQAAAPGDDVFSVTAMTERGRVAMRAWEATRAGVRLTPAEVTADQRAPAFTVVVVPRMPWPYDKAFIPASIKGIELRGRDQIREHVVKPTGALSTAQTVWKNPAGGTVDVQSATAVFELADVQRLPGRAMMFAVATTAGWRTCEMDSDRVKRVLKTSR